MIRSSMHRTLCAQLVLVALAAACSRREIAAADPAPSSESPENDELSSVRSSSGVLLAQGRLVGGLREGEWTMWHEDGSLRWEGEYRAGLLEGRERGWHPGGALWFEGERRAGLREGLYRYWYETGALELEAQFARDLREGACKRYDIEGRLDASESGLWRAGVKVDEP